MFSLRFRSVRRLVSALAVAAALAGTALSTTEALDAAQRRRVGARCNDGTQSKATGSGACSHHKGVACWIYNDGTCTKP